MLGRDLLVKMRAQIHFKPRVIQLFDQKGNPIQVLTLDLASETEYRLCESPASPEQDLNVWLTMFPQLGTETRDMWLAEHLSLYS